MASDRQAILRSINPSIFAGIPLRKWLRVLKENRFAVSPPYWGRAATITALSTLTSAAGCVENAIYGRKIRNTGVKSPVFILGIWRSGTTHLFNLLSQDDRFAFPNVYQAIFPHTFLCTERTGVRLLGPLVASRRPQDHVRFGLSVPAEDEFALCPLIGRSLFVGMAFPRNSEFYDRYLTLRDLSDAELSEWNAAFKWFVQKLTLRYRRPLLLKSPGATCRIKVLLELFPDARFVHIHRNPYAVYRSFARAIEAVSPMIALQRAASADLDERIFRLYEEILDAFFEQRRLIPESRFCEVRFEDLEKDPLVQVRSVYERLGLPDFRDAEPALRRYVDSLSGYNKNVPEELPADLRKRIAQAGERCFAEWGYPR